MIITKLMMIMNWIDFAIIGVVAVSTLISLVRGFLKEAISLTIWFSARFLQPLPM